MHAACATLHQLWIGDNMLDTAETVKQPENSPGHSQRIHKLTGKIGWIYTATAKAKQMSVSREIKRWDGQQSSVHERVKRVH